MSEAAPASAVTVLCVDDEVSLLKMLSRRLESWGYRVLTAENGEEGIRLAKAQRPNVVLLDVMMPGIDGLEVCRLLKGEPETWQIPIILVTAKATQLAQHQIEEAKVFAFVQKPYDPDELRTLIRQALEAKSG